MKVNERINKLRELMSSRGIDAYIVDNADHHSSEYVNPYFKERTYMSSFDGSNGTLLITKDEAFLWTDGRYFLQAELDLKDTEIKLMKMGVEVFPSLDEYIKTNLKGKTIGFDGECFSSSFGEEISEYLTIKSDEDLVGLIFENRGKIKFSEIWPLSIEYSGESHKSKLERVRKEIKENNATSLILTSLDDIAWFYNLRGGDVPITPVFLSFAYISLDKEVLFLNTKSLNSGAKKALKEDNVELNEYMSFSSFLKELKDETILVSQNKLSYLYLKLIKENNKVIDKDNPTLNMKAIKNSVEIKNNREIHEYDGLAVFRFMKYLKEAYRDNVKLSEFPMAEKVLEYRKMCDKFYEVSFETIASWNSNGAIVHYEPTKESSMAVEGSGFFLLDSGGQYMGGTTDITRTMMLGDISQEMKHHYTMVLKGLISVSSSKFIKGTTGRNIDMLSREIFWKEGLDYRHGTGHGIGYMLNVHEGPQAIRYQNVANRYDMTEFKPGMVTSIEPGIYLSGKYGIRLENEILCKEDMKTEWGDFYSFETLTICPFDLEPVLIDEVTEDERKWLNDYHKMVYDKLSKLVNKEELETLKEFTRQI